MLVAVSEAYGDAHQRMLPLGETFEDAAATPGATWSSLRARLRSSRSAFLASSSPRALRSASGPTHAGALGSRSITLLA